MTNLWRLGVWCNKESEIITTGRDYLDYLYGIWQCKRLWYYTNMWEVIINRQLKYLYMYEIKKGRHPWKYESALITLEDGRCQIWRCCFWWEHSYLDWHITLSYIQLMIDTHGVAILVFILEIDKTHFDATPPVTSAQRTSATMPESNSSTRPIIWVWSRKSNASSHRTSSWWQVMI